MGHARALSPQPASDVAELHRPGFWGWELCSHTPLTVPQPGLGPRTAGLARQDVHGCPESGLAQACTTSRPAPQSTLQGPAEEAGSKYMQEPGSLDGACLEIPGPRGEIRPEGPCPGSWGWVDSG